MNHAEKWNQERDARARAMVVEASPSRWKAILWIAIVALSLYFTSMFLLSYGH